jgi:hypothetical protein
LTVANMGQVAVGCPKIWTSDRVFTVLDGLVRDVDSITIRALQGLDPNMANQAVLETLTTQFNVQGQFDQGAALKNQVALQNFGVQHTAQLTDFKSNEAMRQDLLTQKTSVTQKLMGAQSKEVAQIAAGANPNPQPANDPSKWSEQDKELQTTKNVEAAYNAQLTSINTQLGQLQSSDLPSPSVTSTGAPTSQTSGPSPTPIPDALQKALADQIAKGSFPPTVQMDNVIDLLHERLAREFAAMYDDLMRESMDHDIYLVEFDVSVLPTSGAKDRNMRLTFNFPSSQDDNSCSFRAYDLYPNAAAYNILRGFQKTTHIGLTGVAQTLFGFGLAASYQRDHSTLQSGLSQSLYTTSFGAGLGTFGWEFAPNPNDRTVAPGPRLVYAVLLVDRGTRDNTCAGKFAKGSLVAEWIRRDQASVLQVTCDGKTKAAACESTYNFRFPDKPRAVDVEHVSYVPQLSDNVPFEDDPSVQQAPAAAQATASQSANPATTGATAPKDQSGASGCTDCVAIQIRLFDKVDPNLIVTANDKLLYRVRDERGRGLFLQQGQSAQQVAGSDIEQKASAASRFGLLERDVVSPDSWYLTDSYTLILNVSKATAGTDRFPIIRFGNPSSRGGELMEVSQNAYDIRVGDWQFVQPGSLPSTAFVPLFSEPYGRGPIRAYVEGVTPGANPYPSKIRIVSYGVQNGKEAWLHDAAQVVLEAELIDGQQRFICASTKENECSSRMLRSGLNYKVIQLQPRWALDCTQDRGELVCDMPLKWMFLTCSASTNRDNSIELDDLEAGVTDYFEGSIAHGRSVVPDIAGCYDDLKVWVDQAPFHGRLGIWGDDDLRQHNGTWRPEWIPDWKFRVADFEPAATNWNAELCVRNLEPTNHYCVCDVTAGPPCIPAATYPPGSGSRECFDKTTLSLNKPYKELLRLSSPASLTLAQADEAGRCDATHKPQVPISPLYPALLPANLVLTQTTGLAVIQGWHLGGVVAVYLQNGSAPLPPITKSELTRSARQLSFAIPAKAKGTYAISLGLDGPGSAPELVPALQKGGKALTLTIPEAAKTTAPSEETIDLSVPGTATVGTALKNVVVTVKDASGKTNTKFTGKVKFVSSTDKKVTVPAEYTFTAGDKGVHEFDDVITFNSSGDQKLQVTSGPIKSDEKTIKVQAAATPGK